ncbi:hypothetical protein [Bradyrhizobium sp. 25ACV]
MRARDLYAQLKAAIERAEAQKQYDLPIDFAVANGFSKKETSSASGGLAFECSYFADDGAIRLEYRSWDPSGPFQNLPDINRYFLTLYEPSDRYALDYPD